jgi:non-homologous end joining protein Ku
VDEGSGDDSGERGNVIDLVAALRKSVAQNQPDKPVKKSRRAG